MPTPYFPSPINWGAALNQGLLWWTRPFLGHGLADQCCDLVTAEAKAFNAHVDWGPGPTGVRSLRGSGTTGANSELTMSNVLTQKISTQLTIAAVFSPRRVNDHNEICSTNNAGGTYPWGFRVSSGAKLMAYSQRFATITGATSLTIGQRYHLALTVDTVNGARIWVDGKQDASTTYAGTSMTGTVPFRVFGSNTDQYSGNGDLEDLRIYDRSLSADEIVALMRAAAAGYPDEIHWAEWSASDVLFLPPPPPANVPLPAFAISARAAAAAVAGGSAPCGTGLIAAALAPPTAVGGGVCSPRLTVAARVSPPGTAAGGTGALPGLPIAADLIAPAVVAGGTSTLPTVACGGTFLVGAIAAAHLGLPRLTIAANTSPALGVGGGLCALSGLAAAAAVAPPTAVAGGTAPLPGLAVGGTVLAGATAPADLVLPRLTISWDMPPPAAVAGGASPLPGLAAAVSIPPPQAVAGGAQPLSPQTASVALTVGLSAGGAAPLAALRVQTRVAAATTAGAALLWQRLGIGATLQAGCSARAGLFFCAGVHSRPRVSARLTATPQRSAQLIARPRYSARLEAAAC